MKMEKVSVITTVKNGEKYVEELLYSVYMQNYDIYEHIIVDDGSSDNTVKIINHFCKKNKNHFIKVVRNDCPGRGRALNNGIKKASGKWIAIADVDDLWHPEKIMHQIHQLKMHDIQILCTGTKNIYDRYKVQYSPYIQEAIDCIRFYDMLKMNMVCHSSVIMKKDICVYDEDIKSQYDYELWLRLLSDGYKIYCDKNILTYHRIHEKQSFEAKMGKKYRYRSFLLKMKYSASVHCYKAMIYNIIKLIYDLLMPRKVRIKISDKCGINKIAIW